MKKTGHHLGFLRQLTWVDSLLVVAVLIGYGLLVLLVRLLVARAAENAPSHRRLVVLRAAPIARLIIAVAGLALIIPHAKLWSTSISHDGQGTPSVLTVTNFYPDADDDGDAVRQFLTEIAEANAHRKSDSPVKVTAAETHWDAQYRVKAHAAESREQFALITDLTLRAKARLRAMNVAFARAPYSESQARPLWCAAAPLGRVRTISVAHDGAAGG